MNQIDSSIAKLLLAMPAEELRTFVYDKIRARQLSPVVRTLNRQVLSHAEPSARLAREALNRIGFAE